MSRSSSDKPDGWLCGKLPSYQSAGTAAATGSSTGSSCRRSCALSAASSAAVGWGAESSATPASRSLAALEAALTASRYCRLSQLRVPRLAFLTMRGGAICPATTINFLS